MGHFINSSNSKMRQNHNFTLNILWCNINSNVHIYYQTKQTHTHKNAYVHKICIHFIAASWRPMVLHTIINLDQHWLFGSTTPLPQWWLSWSMIEIKAYECIEMEFSQGIWTPRMFSFTQMHLRILSAKQHNFFTPVCVVIPDGRL